MNKGTVLTGRASAWDDLTEQGTYLVSNCSDIPGNAYSYGVLLVLAVPVSNYGRVQVYIPDAHIPIVLVRARFNNNTAWKSWGRIASVAI